MKTALILGAASDISVAIAHRWAADGYRLQLAARNSNRLQSLKSDLEIRHKTEVDLMDFDAHDYEGHKIFYDTLSHKPDIVFCVFGYLGEHEQAKVDTTELLKIISANYTGAASILNVVAADMEERKSGTIVGVSSVAGDRGRADNYYYGSSKAGFTAFLSGLRGRLAAAGVHVLTVKPGFVDTQMTKGLDLPGPLTAKPDQIAADIQKAVRRKTNVLYSLWMWKWIMLIIMHIPECIFKKMKFGNG